MPTTVCITISIAVGTFPNITQTTKCILLSSTSTTTDFLQLSFIQNFHKSS